MLFIFPDVQIVFEGIKGKFAEEESDTDSQDIETEKPKQHGEDIVGQWLICHASCMISFLIDLLCTDVFVAVCHSNVLVLLRLVLQPSWRLQFFFSVHRTAHSWCMLIALRDKLIALRKFCKKYVTMESVLNVRKTKVFLQRTT